MPEKILSFFQDGGQDGRHSKKHIHIYKKFTTAVIFFNKFGVKCDNIVYDQYKFHFKLETMFIMSNMAAKFPKWPPFPYFSINILHFLSKILQIRKNGTKSFSDSR